MKRNIKMALLLSALSLQTFGATSFASDDMRTVDLVATVTQSQRTNYLENFIGEATLRSIATAIGFPNADTAADTAGTTSAPLSAIVNDINAHIGTGASTDNATVLGRLGMPMTAETGADLKTITVFSQLSDIDADTDSIKVSIGKSDDTALTSPATLFGKLNSLSASSQSTSTSALTLTWSVDNLMNSVFNYDVLSGAINFSGTASSNTPALFSGYNMPAYTSGSPLPSTRTSTPSLFGSSTVDYRGNGSGSGEVKGELQGAILNEYTILAGRPIVSLFNQSSAYFPPSAQLLAGAVISDTSSNFTIITPAEKLSIFLRAIFGISDALYQGWFSSNPLGQEDSGTVLTTIFDNVLGRNGSTALNKFGGPSSGTPACVFNRINAAASTGTATLKPYGSSTAVSNPALTTPSAYFDFVLGTGKTDSKYDILRVRALIQDLFVNADAHGNS